MNEIILTLGDNRFTLGEVLLCFMGILTLIMVFLLYTLINNKALASIAAHEQEQNLREMQQNQNEMNGRMQTLAEVFGSRQNDFLRLFNERLDGMGHKMGESLSTQTRSTMENLSKLNERLGIIDSAQKNIAELAGQVVGLKEILSNKQSRGAFGQGRMEAILQDGLPKNGYSLQFTLSNNKRPDAVIHLPGDERALVVDAKFPFEGLSLWRQAKTEEAKHSAAIQVKSDFMRHVKDIEDKYFIAGETQDLAMLFIPSESLYADLHEYFEEVVQRAFRARIIVVSPSLLMLAIQVVQSLLRDEAMRRQAHVIRQEVGHLSDDLRRLQERVLNLQKHFGQANDDVAQILISADKVMKRAGRIDSLEFEEKKPEPVVAKLLR
jgi:DNA recombination protein RmuC